MATRISRPATDPDAHRRVSEVDFGMRPAPAQKRLDPDQVLKKAETILRARLQLAPMLTSDKCTNEDLATTTNHLHRQLGLVAVAAEELEKEEAKVRRALLDQNAVVEASLAAALQAFPAQASRINLVNRAFSNAGVMRRLQLRAISWEKIWETLDPEWQPTPGLTLLSFRERRLKLDGDWAAVGRVWMQWRLADEMCQAIAARVAQGCMQWSVEAQPGSPPALPMAG